MALSDLLSLTPRNLTPEKMLEAINTIVEATVHLDNQVRKIGRRSASEFMIGTILPFAGTSMSDRHWLLCDGAPVSRSTYARLFGAVGSTYGDGDGKTTFNVPDLRDRMPIGAVANLGAHGGSFDHTHGPGTLSVKVAGTNAQTPVAPVPVAAEGTYSLLGATAPANPPFLAVYFIIRAL